MELIPPSIDSIWPVTQPEVSFNKNSTALAISEGVPILFKGCLCALASIFWSEFNKLAASGVLVKEGAIQFTLMLGTNSAANALVKPSMAPLELATRE